jgi:hypothetical protein
MLERGVNLEEFVRSMLMGADHGNAAMGRCSPF